MSRRRKKARALISSIVEEGEVLTEFANAGIKTPAMSTPAPAWIVVTDRRLLLCRDTCRGRAPVGQRLYEARHEELKVSCTSGLLHRVIVGDATTGKTIVRLHVGRRRALAKAVIAAGATTPADTGEPVDPSGGVIDLRPGERLPDGTVLTASQWLRAARDADGRYR